MSAVSDVEHEECMVLFSDDYEEFGSDALEDGRFTEVIDLILPCARTGLPEAEFSLAFILASAPLPEDYLNGFERDPVFWVYRAALQGHDRAANMLANGYEKGWFGLARDDALALCWSEVAEHERNPQDCDFAWSNYLNQ